VSDLAAKETTRTEAFSDGVFAIAITLLILDIKVPPIPEGFEALARGEASAILRRALLAPHQLASYVAYFMSFSVILVMWVNHHRIFTLLKKTDNAFLYWNGLLLMLISIVPFPTSLLADYFLTPAARIGALVYAGHGFFISLAFQGVWRHAIRNERLLLPGTKDEVARLTAQYRFGPLMYLVAFVLAFFSAWLSIGLCLLFAIFFSLQGFSQRG